MASMRTVALAATAFLAVTVAAVIGAGGGGEQGSRNAGSSAPTHPSGPAASSTTAPDTRTPTRSSQPSTVVPSDHPTSATATSATGSPGAAGTPGATGTPGTTGPLDPGGPATGILPTPTAQPPATGGGPTPAPTAEPPPLLGDTLPDTAAAVGALVEGFPAALAPPEGTQIMSSSVVVDDGVLQATLVTTGGDPQAILEHYRDVLRARGFAEGHMKGPDPAPSAAFTKGKDRVTVMTVDQQTSLLANLHAKGRKHG